jgi:hypothetical protein
MDEPTKNKPCIKCGSFRRYPPRPGTKTGACIDCSNARAKKWEHTNKERVKEIQASYKVRNIETWKKSKQKSAEKERKLNPVKIQARMEVKLAIEKGLLPSLLNCNCFICKKPAKDYHHENYNEPLNVIPLCRYCHVKRHRQIKKESIEPCAAE